VTVEGRRVSFGPKRSDCSGCCRCAHELLAVPRVAALFEASFPAEELPGNGPRVRRAEPPTPEPGWRCAVVAYCCVRCIWLLHTSAGGCGAIEACPALRGVPARAVQLPAVLIMEDNAFLIAG
jgi:hypothetical protein